MNTICSTSNAPFIKIDSAIFFDRSIKQTCRDIYVLALDLSKIPNWIIRKQYIADQLGVSLRTVNRYFSVLAKLGYAYYDEAKHRWHVFRTPKPNKAATSTGGGEPHLDAINQIDNYSEEKPLPDALPDQQKSVVVSSEQENLIFPVQLTDNQKKEAKKKIKKAPIHLQQAILYCLARCIASGTVKSPLAYLSGLITRANNGTFEVIGAAGATITDSRHTDDTKKLLEARQAALEKAVAPEKAKSFIQQARSAIRNAL